MLPVLSSPGFSLRFISRWGRALGEKWQRDMLKKQLASYKRETGAVARVVGAAEFDTSPNLMGALSASICRWFDYQQSASRLLEKRFTALSPARKSWTSKKGETDRFPKRRRRRRRRQIPGEERKSFERALISSLKCSIVWRERVAIDGFIGSSSNDDVLQNCIFLF